MLAEKIPGMSEGVSSASRLSQAVVMHAMVRKTTQWSSVLPGVHQIVTHPKAHTAKIMAAEKRSPESETTAENGKVLDQRDNAAGPSRHVCPFDPLRAS